MRYIFAGNRDIAVWVLQDLIAAGFSPEMLWIPDEKTASHTDELRNLSKLPDSHIITGKKFLEQSNISEVNSIRPDYIFSIHYPYIIPKNILVLPKYGFLNLHPSFLPFNKGWHTPTWAIQQGTPAGATLHFMTEKLDMGDIIVQEKIQIESGDTANSLYKKIKQLERTIFKNAIPDLSRFHLPSKVQLDEGSSHLKADLFNFKERKIELGRKYVAEELLKDLRAFTTNQDEEAMYFEKDGERYYVQVKIFKDIV
ncbi:MAG: formyltransferase family protein [Ferruginibacter sp.]